MKQYGILTLIPPPLFKTASLEDFLIVASRDISAGAFISGSESPVQTFAYQHICYAWVLDYYVFSGNTQQRKTLVGLLTRPLTWGGMIRAGISPEDYRHITKQVFLKFYWPLMLTEPQEITFPHIAQLAAHWSMGTHHMKPNPGDLAHANFLKWAIKPPGLKLSSSHRHQLIGDLYELYLANGNSRHAIGLIHLYADQEFDDPDFQLITKSLFKALNPENFQTDYSVYQQQLKAHYIAIQQPSRPRPFPIKTPAKKKKK